MNLPEITQIYEFIKEINKFKSTYRYSLISPNGRRESDAEHTWHLLMIFWLISDKLNEKIDTLKCFKMLLIHDLVEIYAGDVFGLTTENVADQKKENELKSAHKLFSSIPTNSGKEMHDIWIEYEERKTLESKIVWAIDKLHPRIQWVLSNKQMAENLKSDRVKAEIQEQKMSEIAQFFQTFLI
jgi:putative hydrolases of HD superfamily